MGGRTKIGFWKKERYWKEKLTFETLFMCNGKELRFLLIPIERIVTRIWNRKERKIIALPDLSLRKYKKSAYTPISSTSNLYIRIADRGIIQGVRSTYFIFLSNFIVGFIRTFFALWINNRKKRVFFITYLFYSNKSYMELPAEEKIYLIVSHLSPAYIEFWKEKTRIFFFFLLTLR